MRGRHGGGGFGGSGERDGRAGTDGEGSAARAVGVTNGDRGWAARRAPGNKAAHWPAVRGPPARAVFTFGPSPSLTP